MKLVMTKERNKTKTTNDTPANPWLVAGISAALLTMASTNLFAKDDFPRDGHKNTFYRQVNLVSDQSGVALVQDTNLLNAWGMSFSPTSTFWVNDNGSGRATLYAVTNDSSGFPHIAKQSLEVSIPREGNPTGQLFNDTTNFHGDVFLFVSEGGTISGWRGALGTSAEILATRSGAVYTGATLASVAGVPFLLVANFSEAAVDVYDGDLNLVGQLSDPNAPDGYAPFNVQSIAGTIFVTFARQDADKTDEEAGRGHGLIDVLDLQTQTFRRFATGTDAGGDLSAIDSPWGVALAPSTFGEHANQFLVGNFGSGTIMAFDGQGRFTGFLESSPGRPVLIDGLWALKFGSGSKAGVPGTLYFTAGPADETHGLFGSLEPAAHPAKRNGLRAPEVPADIRVPIGNRVFFHGFAVGFQIYTWNGASWGTAVPDATLFDAHGRVVATHFAGPTWQSISGSRVVGAVVQPTAIVDPNSIPWVLLRALTTEGPGIFEHATFVHRVNTVGGKSPSVDGTEIGQVARSPYTADYFFYRKSNN
jgi:uncharacterized protein (TIGR03118 family)